MAEKEKLDYPRLWKTLLQIGLKETFSMVRTQFFMTVANSGYKIYNGKEDLDKIIEESKVFKIRPELIDQARKAIGENDKFKHFYYETNDGTILIEYFANVSRGISKEFVDFVYKDADNKDYEIEGHCTSAIATDIVKNYHVDSDEEFTETGTNDKTTHTVSVHLIIIGEDNNSFEPEMYPIVIKHELTHACLYDIRKNIVEGYYDNYRIPAVWTDEQVSEWKDNIEYLHNVLESEDKDAYNFREFVCEFMMYESDGQQKVKNPVVESRVPKNVKADAKPKITYRNVTPFDRFQEVIDMYEDGFGAIYEPILESLRPYYEDYETFLEDIRM